MLQTIWGGDVLQVILSVYSAAQGVPYISNTHVQGPQFAMYRAFPHGDDGQGVVDKLYVHMRVFTIAVDQLSLLGGVHSNCNYSVANFH